VTNAYRLGVDIGGTFTDGVLIDEATGATFIDKVLTTPADPSEGFLHVTERLADRVGLRPELLSYIIHATTVATNAVLERRGARVGMLVTQGFRDLLEIARQVRYELYNLQTEKPAPLVPRRLSLEIPERLDYQGNVVLPLDEAAIAEAVGTLRAEGVDAIAICFLHSYQNPAHEQRARGIVQRLYPEAAISVSSEIAPEIREYWRASTTVTNAYVLPLMQRYLGTVEQRLAHAGFPTDVHVVQSSGGIMSAALAKDRPVYMLESGPAAGVAAAAYLAEIAGFADAISFDMGGTTAKVGLIRDNQPAILSEFEVGSVAGSGTGLAKGSGYPILAPVMDLVEVGAGGGSIAWVDSGGFPRVGPRSAGADPGPACYSRGGTEPTVSDANLVMGRLNPGYFLGGEITLDADAAREAIDTHCARPLGLEVVAAAVGIVEIANATMVQAMRLISVQRGYDPREFVLVAFGGAGPIHANQLAHELGIPTVVVPPSPGVASALGMVVSNLRHDYRVTRIQPLAEVDVDELESVLQGFEASAAQTLATEGLTRDQTRFERYLDLRYIGQSWKLPVALHDGDLREDLGRIKARFDAQHEQRYGFHAPEEPVEVVNIALSAIGLIPRPPLKQVPEGDPSPSHALKSSRRVYFSEAVHFVDCPIYDRYALHHGNLVTGPAIIEEIDSTTVIIPGYQAEVANHGILLIRPR